MRTHHTYPVRSLGAGLLALVSVTVLGCSAKTPESQPTPNVIIDPGPPHPPRGRSIPELIKDITKDPFRQISNTPAVEELIEIGEPAIPPLLDLILGEELLTRWCAERALRGISRRLHGYDPRRLDPDEAQRRFNAWEHSWDPLGSLNADGD